MFGIGVPELLVIMVVALVVLGPKRLPEVAKTLGRGLAEFRKATSDLTDELRSAQTLVEDEARSAARAQNPKRPVPVATEARGTKAVTEPAVDQPTTDRGTDPIA